MRNDQIFLDETKSLREERLSSDRSFGLFWTAIFAILAYLTRKNLSATITVSILGFAFLIFSIFLPKKLHNLNRWWFKFSQILSKLWTPIIMAILFYGFLTPYAMILRLFGVTSLKAKKTESPHSYWIESQSQSINFKEQF